MSRCLSRKPFIVLLESRIRQFIYTLIVASCSLTIGMCLEWTWCTTSIEMYQTLRLKDLLFLGAITSAGPAAIVASLVGLKAVLVIGMLFTLCGSVIIVYSMGILMVLYIGRILQGFGAGIVCVIVPNYAAEIADPKIRSLLIGFHYIHMLIGMIFSHVINEFYNYSNVNMGIVAMVVVNLLALLAVDDPPYYRMKFYEKWTSVYNLDYNLQIQDNYNSKLLNNNYYKIFENDDNQYLFLFFTKKRFRRPLLINVCLISIQQFSGQFFLTYKLQCFHGIFTMSETIPFVIEILLLQLITSIICLLIVGVSEKKNLLIISGFGMAITLLLMNAAYHIETIDKDELWLPSLILIYIIFYSIGYGPVPWILMPEICPRSSRLWTSGVTVSLYAFLSLVNNQSFYEIIRLIYEMDIFTFISAIGAYFVYLYVPKIKDCILT
ncbi:facilitated trehalose transporter Tret1-2 homolog [Rhopalosiphum maidis]|uniref:facilitated trehalose transporter Tret1-2 homolog n=1 Tax=Rhopalosiphum maidis TaxID=43146 RepID=UPI000F00CDB9|nr:facilitated trehalose transporter Tret1-2 homolog [Rhopalosiphum maidis]